MEVVSKKTLDKMKVGTNNLGASKPNAFAKRIMEKMGWSEGQCLGKNNDGIAKHIHIAKREDNVGLGLGQEGSVLQQGSLSDNWWHNNFSQHLQRFKSVVKSKTEKKKNKDKKDKKEKKSSKEDASNESKKRKRSDSDDESGENDSNSNSDKEKKKKSKKSKKEKVEKSDILNGFGDDDDIGISYDELYKATGGARLGMRARRKQEGKILRTEVLYEANMKNKEQSASNSD